LCDLQNVIIDARPQPWPTPGEYDQAHFRVCRFDAPEGYAVTVGGIIDDLGAAENETFTTWAGEHVIPIFYPTNVPLVEVK
jgi:hypothetical protein